MTAAEFAQILDEIAKDYQWGHLSMAEAEAEREALIRWFNSQQAA